MPSISIECAAMTWYLSSFFTVKRPLMQPSTVMPWVPFPELLQVPKPMDSEIHRSWHARPSNATRTVLWAHLGLFVCFLRPGEAAHGFPEPQKAF